MKTYINPIDLKLDDYFEEAFADKLIPSNSFIDKSKTGLGMTYSEFHADRHSLIVIPSLQIIDDKCRSYKYKHPIKVWDDVSVEDVKTYLTNCKGWMKIVCTPEAFIKVIDASTELNKFDWLRKNVFCLLDEVHCYATDAYRVKILRPFMYFWKFKRKAVGSATPYPFTDKRFGDLQHYKIMYKEKFGTITIVNHDKPMEALNHFLRRPNMFKGNVHIFFNSVREIGKAIETAKLKDVNIFCRDVESNKQSLGEAVIHFRERPEKGMFKKFNFYSCKFNEGWDLYDDENATMILVTDTRVKHSLVGIQYKGFQAVGRLRSDIEVDGKPIIIRPDMIYHITNTHGIQNENVQSFEYIRDNWYTEAELHVKYYNLFKTYMEDKGFIQKDLTKILIRTLAIRREGVAEVYPMKVDQVICNEYCLQCYSNEDTIAQAWQERNYDTEVVVFDIKPIVSREKKRSLVNRDAVEIWEDHRLHPEKYRHGIAERSIDKLKDRLKNLHSAYLAFGVPKLQEIDYEDKSILANLVDLNNANISEGLKHILCKRFKQGVKYTRDEIKLELNELYSKYEMLRSSGKKKKPTAADLELFGFKIKPASKTVDGKRLPALLILKGLDCEKEV